MTDKLCFGLLQEFLRHPFLSKTENLKFGLEINIIDKKTVQICKQINSIILAVYMTELTGTPIQKLTMTEYLIYETRFANIRESTYK